MSVPCRASFLIILNTLRYILRLSKNVADGAKGNVLFYYLDKPSLLPAAAKQPKQIVGLFTLEPEWLFPYCLFVITILQG